MTALYRVWDIVWDREDAPQPEEVLLESELTEADFDAVKLAAEVEAKVGNMPILAEYELVDRETADNVERVRDALDGEGNALPDHAVFQIADNITEAGGASSKELFRLIDHWIRQEAK